MPIEIKELVIRAVVETGARPDREAGAPGETASSNEAIVEACVRQVMKILRKSKER